MTLLNMTAAARPHVSPPRPAIAPTVVELTEPIPYADAKVILARYSDRLPTELNGLSSERLESAWPAFVSRHDSEVRARLERGDEDSVVNFWYYGVTFTRAPRATARGIAQFTRVSSHHDPLADVIQTRLDDLVAGAASPGWNDRLRLVREVLALHGIDPTTPGGKEQAERYLIAAAQRADDDAKHYQHAYQAADPSKFSDYSELFHDRGLSSDTALPVNFAVEQALSNLKAEHKLPLGTVRRVAIIGPGLDITDKAEGFDFYPEQTIQPFAVIDSLVRLGLSPAGDLRLVTFDLNPRVNRHMQDARQRALNGETYVLQLPLDLTDPLHQWQPDLIAYWKQFGNGLGEEVAAIPVPRSLGPVKTRAVRVKPEIVLSITPMDLNIVLERLVGNASRPSAGNDERFDLILATNVLVYYSSFEQGLALINVSKMLKPGGLFLTNHAVFPVSPLESSPCQVTVVYWDRQRNLDRFFSYRRD